MPEKIGPFDTIDQWLISLIQAYKGEVVAKPEKGLARFYDSFMLDVIIQDSNNTRRDIGEYVMDNKQINDIAPYGRPLFSYFAEYGYTTLVETLLSYGIPADASCKSNSRTPLSYAVENGHYHVVLELLGEKAPEKKGLKKADVNVVEKKGLKIADINATSNGKSILYYALSKLDEDQLEGKDDKTIRHHTALQMLLKHKPSVALLPIEAYLKLFKFVWHRIKKSPNTAEDLLSVMAIHERLIVEKEEKDINHILQAIKSARAEGNLPKGYDLAALLTKQLYKSYKKETPLSTAVRSGNRVMVKALLDLNCPINGDKNTTSNLLSVAIEQGHQEIFEWLLAKATSADINQLEDKDKPPLYYAIDKGNIAMVKALLERGASLTQRYGKKKLTPLLYALSLTRCSSDLIDLLMKDSSKLKDVDTSGHGVLWYAFYNNHIDAAKRLVYQLKSSNCSLPEMYDLLACAQTTQRKEWHELLEPYVLAVLHIEVECLAEWTTIVNNPNSSGEQIGKNKKNKKDLIFTTHAKARIEEREISKETITTVFNNRKSNTTGVFSIAIDIPLSTKPLRVIVHETPKKIIVITTYWKD